MYIPKIFGGLVCYIYLVSYAQTQHEIVYNDAGSNIYIFKYVLYIQRHMRRIYMFMFGWAVMLAVAVLWW